MTKLTLDDIADLRAYERERDAFRARVIELKKKRRVAVGPFVTLVFENRDTIRFQIQEMARAERMLTDEAIQTELDIYNPLIPEPGRLSATLFVELTSKDELMEWLPKLVGIERAVRLRIGDDVVVAEPEASHADQLTREDVTASVHYVGFDLTAEQVRALVSSAVTLEIDHPRYQHATTLLADTVAELAADVTAGEGGPLSA
ncbi:MAG TPA: DUF3501 family protein [Acidimicrobiales bacterium]|nr:DUF3501 family protein [Acidimicrobiales bacterium]